MEKNIMLKTPDEVQKNWEKLTIALNQFDSGPKKTSNEWKSTFSKWKSYVYQKTRTINNTGDGEQCNNNFSALEKRALACWGGVPGDGATIEDIDTGTSDSDDNVLIDETASGSLFPTSHVSSTSETVTPHTKLMPQEPTTSKSLQTNSTLPKSRQAPTFIDAFEEHDQHFTDALNNLANGIEKLSTSIEDTNKTFRGVMEALVKSTAETNNMFQSIIHKQHDTVINLLHIAKQAKK